ncbi:hypothetical protein [Oleispirillum naphthae]|uniref:hypothetical protein n=1 Tax=Oleispirillum naphthae TaxID=2838853 RepID=UPI00308242C3
MKTIYLHIGSPKTGTTTLQAVLQSRCPTAVTPDTFRKTHFFKEFDHHVFFLPHKRRDFTPEFIADFLQEDSDAPLIVSEELLSVPPLHNRAFFPGMPHTATLIQGLRRHGYEVKVLFIVRHLLPFLESWYLQSVGTGHCADDFCTFIEQWVHNPINWSGVVERLLETGAETTILPYEMLRADTDAFVARLNLFFDGHVAFRREDFSSFQNKTINTDVYKVMRAVSTISDKRLATAVGNILREHLMEDSPQVRPHEGSHAALSPIFREALTSLLFSADSAFAVRHLPQELWKYWM